MSNIYKGELQDNQGNTIYPHTEADLVFCADGTTIQSKVAEMGAVTDGVTGRTDSLEVSDSNILATSKATNALNQKFGGLTFGVDGDGNCGYYGADGSLIPFKSTEIIDLGSGSSFDVSSYPGYENFTEDNFIVEMGNLSGWNNQTNSTINSTGTYYFSNVSISLTKTYDAETGKLTANYKATNKYGTHMASTPHNTVNKTINVKAYLILK